MLMCPEQNVGVKNVSDQCKIHEISLKPITSNVL